MVGDTARGVLGRLCELSPGKMLTATPCRVRSRGVSALLLTFAAPLFLTHTELSLFVEKFRGLNNDSTSASPTVESFGSHEAETRNIANEHPSCEYDRQATDRQLDVAGFPIIRNEVNFHSL